MKRNEIEFDAEALVGSVEAFAAHAQGKQKLTLAHPRAIAACTDKAYRPAGHHCTAPEAQR